jgi:hypothetical protein
MATDYASENCENKMSIDSSTHLAPKLVFIHVMKTGGTSLIEWIQRHYHYDDILYEASIWQEFWNLPADRLKRKRFIRGHFGSYITRYFKPCDGFRYITLLRNPVERVISHFWHAKRATDSDYLEIADQEAFGIKEFLEDARTFSFASNFQVRNFVHNLHQNYQRADPRPRRVLPDKIGQKELDQAKAFLDSIDFVGFTEDLPGTIAAMSARFGFFPDQNLGNYRSYSEAETISAEMLKKILDAN